MKRFEYDVVYMKTEVTDVSSQGVHQPSCPQGPQRHGQGRLGTRFGRAG